MQTTAATVLDKFQYEELIADKGIRLEDISVEIKRKMHMLVTSKAGYMKKPTEAKLAALKRQDVVIHELLLDWWEKDNVVEETEEEIAAKAKAVAEAEEQKAAEEELKKIIKSDGRIHRDMLQKLMSKPVTRMNEEFAGIKLRKSTVMFSINYYYPVS